MVIRSWIQIPDHFFCFLTIAKLGILGDLLAFLIQSPADFYNTGEMTDDDKNMKPQHFGSDPILISLEIRIPRSVMVEVDASAEVYTLWEHVFL